MSSSADTNQVRFYKLKQKHKNNARGTTNDVTKTDSYCFASTSLYIWSINLVRKF